MGNAPIIFNPNRYDPVHFDEETRQLMRATIDWFEGRGKKAMIESYGSWCDEFLAFAARAGLFSSCLVPAADGTGKQRWDTARNHAFNELLGFYGINGWYTWHVTILGLAPFWQSANLAARQRAVELLEEGCSAAFALSEQSHGADIYATDLVLTPAPGGGFLANGSKYYIGNGNVANVVSVFGRRSDIDGPDGYVFFAADSRHEAYTSVRNVANQHLYVAELRFDDYPVQEEDILHSGKSAFDVALNSVNIGKFNLAGAGIGACEHALHEAINHAHNRILYGHRVTDFPHIRRILSDAYLRLVAMKLFTSRTVDYVRSAAAADRRYILFNAMTKTKVTTEAQQVVSLLWDVIAAKGFEADTHFNWIARDLPGLPRLEGTVHVNIALILKFMRSYLLEPAPYAPVPSRLDPSDDSYLFQQAPVGRLGEVRFHDWRPVFDAFADLRNVSLFREQLERLSALVVSDGLNVEQGNDLTFSLALGELFVLVVYGHLILEQAAITALDRDLVDEIFGLLVRDLCTRLVDFHGNPAATAPQQAWALASLRRPAWDEARAARVWSQVEALAGAYEMRP